MDLTSSAKTYPKSGNLFGLPSKLVGSDYNKLISHEFIIVSGNIAAAATIEYPLIATQVYDPTQLDIEFLFSSVLAFPIAEKRFNFIPQNSLTASTFARVAINTGTSNTNLVFGFNPITNSVYVTNNTTATVALSGRFSISRRARKIKNYAVVTVVPGASSFTDSPFIITDPSKLWVGPISAVDNIFGGFVNGYGDIANQFTVKHLAAIDSGNIQGSLQVYSPSKLYFGAVSTGNYSIFMLEFQ